MIDPIESSSGSGPLFPAQQSVAMPAVTLRLLLGEGRIQPAAFRRFEVNRFWPCGCVANYRFDRGDDVLWTPCAKHSATAKAS